MKIRSTMAGGPLPYDLYGPRFGGYNCFSNVPTVVDYLGANFTANDNVTPSPQTVNGFGYFYRPINYGDFDTLTIAMKVTASSTDAADVSGYATFTAMLTGDLPSNPTSLGLCWNNQPTIPSTNYTLQVPVSCKGSGYNKTILTSYSVSLADLFVVSGVSQSSKQLVGFALSAKNQSVGGSVSVSYLGDSGLLVAYYVPFNFFNPTGYRQKFSVIGRHAEVIAGTSYKFAYLSLSDYNTISTLITYQKTIDPSLTNVNMFAKGVAAAYNSDQTLGPNMGTLFTDANGQGLQYYISPTDGLVESFTSSGGTLYLP